MQSYANFMHTVNLHGGRSSFISKDMTAIRWQLIEIICVLWFGYFWELDSVLYNSLTVCFHCMQRLTANIDPDANQRVCTFQTSRSLARRFARALSFTISPDCLMIYALYNAQGAFKDTCVPYLCSDLTCLRQRNWSDSLRAAGKRDDLSVKTCFVCRIFFPFSPWKAGCSWWILKQILLIIVFHNCHAERDCPLRSYLCHCISLPLSLPLSLQPLQ